MSRTCGTTGSRTNENILGGKSSDLPPFYCFLQPFLLKNFEVVTYSLLVMTNIIYVVGLYMKGEKHENP